MGREWIPDQHPKQSRSEPHSSLAPNSFSSCGHTQERVTAHPWDPSRHFWARAISRDSVRLGRNRGHSSNDGLGRGPGCITRAGEPGWRDSRRNLEQGSWDPQDGLEQHGTAFTGPPSWEGLYAWGGPQPARVLGSPGSGEMQQFSLPVTVLLYLNSKQMPSVLKLSFVFLADTHERKNRNDEIDPPSPRVLP